MVVLHYISDGTALPNVPARDLRADDMTALADEWGIDATVLLNSGLYVTP